MKTTKTRAAVAAAGLAVGALLLTGCMDKYTEPYKDAPRSHQDDGTPADLIRMPDGFSNIATKCVNGDRYSVIYHGDHPYGALQVTPADPSCR